jgi:tetratricopeptide (TPR) repeat protein
VLRGSPLRLGAVVLVALATASGAAAAQGREDAGAAERRRRAGEHVKKGDAFKEAGDYDAAAREYQKAYEQVPHPVLFFNLGQVFRLKGDRRRALDYYERYLAVDPSGLASQQARRFAAQLRGELARERESRPPERERAAGPDRRGGAPADAGARGRGRGLRIAGLVSAGAGLVAIGAGVKFGLDARRASDDINGHDEGAWPDDLLARQDDGERAERNMILLTAAGAAAIATGGVLYYFGRRARRGAGERAVAVSPAATDGGVGLTVSGRF